MLKNALPKIISCLNISFINKNTFRAYNILFLSNLFAFYCLLLIAEEYFRSSTSKIEFRSYVDVLKRAYFFINNNLPEVIEWNRFREFNDTYYVKNIPASPNFTRWTIVGNNVEDWLKMSDDNITNYGNIQNWVLYRHYGVGVKYEGALIKRGKHCILNTRCMKKFVNPRVTNVVAVVPCVINVGLTAKFTYAHIMLDILPPILLLPESVIRRAYVVHIDHPTSGATKHLYSLVGVPPERVIVAGDESVVFGFEVWTPTPHTCWNSYYYPIKLLRDRIIKRFPPAEEPTRFVLIQRMPESNNRHLTNLNELREKIAQKYPKKNWEIKEAPRGINETARFFGSIKFLFLVGGSACANMYFMHSGTVVAEMMSDVSYIPSGILAVACDIRYCVSKQISIEHFNGPQKLNISYTMNLIDAAYTKLSSN